MMRWDRWIGTLDGRPVMWTRTLFKRKWLTVELHKMVAGDDPGCFHSHPAHAIRVVLWGGYIDEELWRGVPLRMRCRPGYVGRVRPDYIHRIAKLLNGRVSYSLWIKFRKVARIELHGPGWPDDTNTEFAVGAVRVPWLPREE